MADALSLFVDPCPIIPLPQVTHTLFVNLSVCTGQQKLPDVARYHDRYYLALEPMGAERISD